MPAPPAVPGPAGAGAAQPGTAPGGPGIGVPVTIWPHAPVTGRRPGSGPACAPCASCAGSVSRPGAGQIITAFSRPGELVVIPAARTGVLLAAAAAAGRRVLGLAPGPHSCERVMSCLRGLDPARRPLAEVRPGGPALLLEAGNPEAGQAALAVTGFGQGAPPGAWPAGTAGGGEPAAGPGLLYAACQRVLRPGGVLAVITASTPGPGGLHDGPGEAITRARAAGLVYAQHIVAVHAAIRDSQIVPGPGDPAPRRETAVPAPVHSLIHSDVLVFTKP